MLTIISVSYKSKALLEMNYRLVKTLNPNTPFRWIVVQNTPSQDLQNDIAMDDPRFEMIQGATTTEAEKGIIAHGTIHHARALNLAISHADSDLIFTLDPDCFLLLPNWIEAITKHIKKEEVAFFGAPYHPDAYTHYRAFPTATCMIINRGFLHRENQTFLDLEPGSRMKTKRLETSFYFAIAHHCSRRHFVDFFFASKRQKPLNLNDFRFLVRECLERKLPQFFIGSFPDTGYQIYKHYHASFKYESLSVVAKDKRNWLTKSFEFLLPNTHRTFPRNEPWITKKSSERFREFEDDGYQFFWGDQLFAFHIQGTRYLEKDRLKFQDRVLQKLEEFMSDYQQQKKLV